MGVTQWVLIGVLVLMLIGYPILASRKTKAENQKVEERTNSLKRGDEIITTAGLYGKIIEIRQDGSAKKVTIETGNNEHKSYLTIDAYAIYSVLNDDKVPTEIKPKEEKVEIKNNKKKKSKEEDIKEIEVKEEKKEENNTETPVENSSEMKTEDNKAEEKTTKKNKKK